MPGHQRKYGEQDLQRIRADFLAGRPMVQIGAEWGISRERVRQLICKYFPQDYRAGAQVRQQHALDRQHQRRSELLAAVSAWMGEQKSATISSQRLREHFTITAEDLSWLRTQDLPARLVRGGEQNTKRYGDEDLLAAVREVASRSPLPALTSAEYDRLRSQHHPTAACIYQRLGWARALQLAGLPFVAPKRSYVRQFSDEEAMAQVCTFLSLHPHGSRAQYDQWAHQVQAPVASSLHARFGSWPAVIEQAERMAKGL